MKVIFIAKLDCLYMWCTASDSYNDCFDKLQSLLVDDKKYLYTISTIQLTCLDSKNAF